MRTDQRSSGFLQGAAGQAGAGQAGPEGTGGHCGQLSACPFKFKYKNKKNHIWFDFKYSACEQNIIFEFRTDRFSNMVITQKLLDGFPEHIKEQMFSLVEIQIRPGS